MPKKLTGLFTDVFKAQGYDEELSKDFLVNLGRDYNKTIIDVDIPRTTLVDGTGKTFNDFRNECQTEAVYAEHYKQGNFDGGAAVDRYDINYMHTVAELYAEADTHPRGSDKSLAKEEAANAYATAWLIPKTTLRFAYRDDNDVLCGFGLAFNKDKPGSWVLDISKNTTAPIGQRVSTSFSEGELAVKNGPDVQLSSLPEEIKFALNSRFVNQIVSGLIGLDGQVSLEQLEILESKLKVSENIDQKEIKKVNDLVSPEVYAIKLDEFKQKLDTLENNPDENKHNLSRQGHDLLQKIKEVKVKQGVSSLPTLNRILTCGTNALDNPTDQVNITRLLELSQEASKKEPTFWKKLGVGLLMFVGVVVMAAGIILAPLTYGASLAVTLFAAFEVGQFKALFETKEPGLPNSASKFKAALGEIKAGDVVEPPSPTDSDDSGFDSLQGDIPPGP